MTKGRLFGESMQISINPVLFCKLTVKNFSTVVMASRKYELAGVLSARGQAL